MWLHCWSSLMTVASVTCSEWYVFDSWGTRPPCKLRSIVSHKRFWPQLNSGSQARLKLDKTEWSDPAVVWNRVEYDNHTLCKPVQGYLWKTFTACIERMFRYATNKSSRNGTQHTKLVHESPEQSWTSPSSSYSQQTLLSAFKPRDDNLTR